MNCCLDETLRELMSENGDTVRGLARILQIRTGKKVTRGRIYSWLTGGEPRADKVLFACAKYYRVPLVYLLYGIWEESYLKMKDVG
jgi:transcriptional regulator with XRE-family HTH domain